MTKVRHFESEESVLTGGRHLVLDGVRIARAVFENHFAGRRSRQLSAAPQPSDGHETSFFQFDFFRGVEGNLQSGLDLQEFIGQKLEFAGLLGMHVGHENAQLVFRQSPQHLLNFRELNCGLCDLQFLRQCVADFPRDICHHHDSLHHRLHYTRYPFYFCNDRSHLRYV